MSICRPIDPRLPPILRRPTSKSPEQSPSPSGEGVAAEFFTVQVAHGCPITALEWSMNGMRLFSGDEVGQVCVTEIDFASHTTLSRPICREPGHIVQLSYAKPRLAVSSTERTALVDSNEQSPEPQVRILKYIVLSTFPMKAILPRKSVRNLGNAPDSTALHLKIELFAPRPSSPYDRETRCA